MHCARGFGSKRYRQRNIGHFDRFQILNFVSACALAFGTARVGKLRGTCSATENSSRFSEVHKTLYAQMCWRISGRQCQNLCVAEPELCLVECVRPLLCLVANNLHPKQLHKNDIKVMDVLSHASTEIVTLGVHSCKYRIHGANIEFGQMAVMIPV